MSQRKNDRSTDPMVDGARYLWQYRVELLLGFMVFLFGSWSAYRYGDIIGTIIPVVILTVLLSNGYVRPFLVRSLYRAQVRRQIVKGILAARKMTQPPEVLKVIDGPIGEQITIRVGHGDDVQALVSCKDKIAASMRATEIRVRKDPTAPRDSSRARLTVVRHDPLDSVVPLEWPNLFKETIDFWDPIPSAIDEYGNTRNMTLLQKDGGRSCLLGGMPGSGKSNALSIIVASAALDPNVDLWICDGKDYELTDWIPACQAWSGQEGMDAYQTLAAVQSIMNERRTEMRARGQRHIQRGDGMRPQVVVIDEFAWYVSLTTTKVGKKPVGTAIQDLAIDLVRRGRAAGVVVVLAIQRPSHDVMSTSLRDLFGYRWGFRQVTSEASDMVLGNKMAGQGFDATTIEENDEQKGIGFLASEEGRPVRSKAFRIDDEQVKQLAERASGLHIDKWAGQIEDTRVPTVDDDPDDDE